MTFHLEKNSSQALFLQLADQLAARIVSGEFPADARLPAERLLCTELGVARTTVKNAYAELVRRGLAETRTGSGTYALGVSPEHSRAQAEKAALCAVRELHALGLNRRETETLVREALWKRLPEPQRPRVAWVDCSPELLHPMAEKLAECGVTVEPHLVWQVVADPERLLRPHYDAIVTTIMHYEELITVPALRMLRYETAVLSLDRDTVAAIARIPRTPGTRIAALCTTPQFREMIERYLGEFGVRVPCEYISPAEPLGHFWADLPRYTAAILPPDILYRADVLDEVRSRCEKQGVIVIPFTHTFDAGSLIHIREQMQQLWGGMGN